MNFKIETMNVTLTGANPMAAAFVEALLRRGSDGASGEVIPPSALAEGIPPIGATWPGQGGRNGGLMRGIDGAADYWLILAEGDGAKAEIAWGGYEKDADGANSLHDGLSNTTALAASKHDHPAAKFARAARVDGKDDWYLPAIRECRLLSATVPELFDSGYHWSSSQCSRSSAWVQNFDDGTQSGASKAGAYRVRLVRRLFL